MAKRSRNVVVNAGRWSRSSKQSFSYASPPEHYEDIYYSCWRCKAPSVFTGEEQKEAFEVRQAYIWQRRILCQPCWKTRRELETRARNHAALWRAGRSKLRRDKRFLTAWLAALEELPGYAARQNTANIAMLKKLLAGAA